MVAIDALYSYNEDPDSGDTPTVESELEVSSIVADFDAEFQVLVAQDGGTLYIGSITARASRHGGY
jgi:hypothetical protein